MFKSGSFIYSLSEDRIISPASVGVPTNCITHYDLVSFFWRKHIACAAIGVCWSLHQQSAIQIGLLTSLPFGHLSLARRELIRFNRLTFSDVSMLLVSFSIIASSLFASVGVLTNCITHYGLVSLLWRKHIACAAIGCRCGQQSTQLVEKERRVVRSNFVSFTAEIVQPDEVSLYFLPFLRL
ncbi:hypothetical protein HMPREF0765_4233 [Sphingobacterium spiritivorum ATCC 33300]|uniref:Uncharacterized protein n=1 Tax=Sphingobacterium spiritivorum ATCC 33300 TaxID=525372 RepID=C2G3S7_SPHSI|nr:hypothetical protein HMPREF0765_4233 [Sphingobacterium spiritivorum ATCC 33300]